MINSSIHQELQQWLEQAIQAQAIHPPQPLLYHHIATCDRCRAMIVLAAQRYPKLFPNPTTANCDQIDDDLSSFIEIEQQHPQQAIQEFPVVWWHILTCEACAELYSSLRITLNAEQTGALVAPSVFNIIEPSRSANLARQLLQTVVPTYNFTFAREFLNQALQITPRPTMRRYRSKPDPYEKVKILEDNPNLQIGESSYHFKLLLKTNQDSWSFVATLEPAFAGWFTVRLGKHTYRQTFNQHGMSSLSNLPNDQLVLIDGPDLNISIDPSIG